MCSHSIGDYSEKMSLYWNDAFWFLDQINRKKKYLNSFACVRTLFISNINLKKWGSQSDIFNLFKKYGAVEKVEILPEKYPINEQQYYAYVTFVDSMSAFRALRDAKSLKGSIQVTPADTWKQPNYIDKFKHNNYLAEDGEISLNQLNEYCLLEIFCYLDLSTLIQLSKICSRFANIITHRIFPKHKSVEFNFDRKVKTTLTVASMRETLLSIGDHVTHAQLKFSEFETAPNTIRIVDIFTKNIGENIEWLLLRGIHISERMYLQLKPILSRLIVLKLYDDYYDDNYEIDLVNVCTNLRKLTLQKFMQFKINVKPWEKLESITFGMYSFPENTLFPVFFQNNPNLKRLKANGFYYEAIVNFVSFYLKNLEILDIFFCPGGFARKFEPLLQLSKLKVLKIMTLESMDNNPTNVINLVSKMSQLSRLKLGFDLLNDEAIYVPEVCLLPLMAKKLENLKRFHLENYTLSDNSLIDFLKMAPQLDELCLANCNLTINEALIIKICDIRKSQSNKRRTNPMPLTMKLDVYAKDEIDDFLKKEEISRLIKIEILIRKDYLIY